MRTTLREVPRRQFLMLSAGAAIGVRVPSATFNHPIGVQLYTVRDILPAQPEETIRSIAEIGYRELEVSGDTLIQLESLFERFSLSPVSGHFAPPLVTGNWEAWKNQISRRDSYSNWKTAVDQAQKSGLKYMVIAYLLPQERDGLDAYRGFARQMNRAGEESQKAGIKLCYHHHAFEFEPMEGTSPIEILMEHFDPDLVGLQLDVFWCSIAGVDPVSLLERYPGRIPLMHLKDKAAGYEGDPYSQDVPAHVFEEVGDGVIDFPAVLRSAQNQGVHHYFVEQDFTPGNPLLSLRQSYNYLSNLSL